jgi:hypothetical protein
MTCHPNNWANPHLQLFELVLCGELQGEGTGCKGLEGQGRMSMGRQLQHSSRMIKLPTCSGVVEVAAPNRSLQLPGSWSRCLPGHQPCPAQHACVRQARTEKVEKQLKCSSRNGRSALMQWNGRWKQRLQDGGLHLPPASRRRAARQEDRKQGCRGT